MAIILRSVLVSYFNLFLLIKLKSVKVWEMKFLHVPFSVLLNYT